MKIFFAAIFLFPLLLCASDISNRHVTASIQSENSTFQPGEEQWIGIHLQMQRGWHSYWKFPGDTGLATKVQWQLPHTWQISEAKWPLPERIEVPPLINFGYKEEALLGFVIKIPAAEVGQKKISAKVSWLVCKEECIPESAELDFLVNISSEQKSKKNKWFNEFEKLRSQQPKKLEYDIGLQATNSKFLLRFPERETIGASYDFFPLQAGLVKGEKPVWNGEAHVLELNRSDFTGQSLRVLEGILVETKAGRQSIFSVSLPLPSKIEKKSYASLDLFFAAFLAFLGGLILNFMPCVFPVLGIKVMSLVQHHGSKQKLHGQVYTLGILISFWILTIFLLALREAGHAIGWGFQLQQPGFVLSLIFLFTLLSANLIGFFEVTGRWMGAGAALAGKDGYTGTFFTGALAVIVATPCTAPFMGAAIGTALTQPIWGVFLIFTMLGAGLAFPILVFCAQPRLLKFLPKPGLWMERVKKLFALPLILTVVWLIWVLSLQIGEGAIARVLWAVALVLFSIFLGKKVSGFSGFILGLLVFTSALSLGFSVLQMPREMNRKQGSIWEEYSEAALQKAISDGRPIFIDFTAAWCLTCQVNEQLVLNKKSMRDFFISKNILLLKGDWTNNDPKITKALEYYGRIGVPLYVAYRKGSSEPILLPQILTESAVKAAY